jgi:hypothetical protein
MAERWELAVPGLEAVGRFSVTVGEIIEVGQTVRGRRRIIPITGGVVDGPHFAGTVLPGGADMQLIRPDGVVEVAARYAVETDRGTHVFVENTGLRHGPPELIERLARGEPVDPDLLYFRTTPRFETDDPALGWLERDVFVATAARLPSEVWIDVFRLT